MRDDFPTRAKETLAKRVGFRCSNPLCRHLTSGPKDDPDGAINLGVAAHISAASEGGPRYNPELSSTQRRSIENGIWLCQNCAKLIDSDTDYYDEDILRQWKELAESLAAKELTLGRTSACDVDMFLDLETLMPGLLDEMREDLKAFPARRELILCSSAWSINHRGPILCYYYERYPDLDDFMHTLENYGLIRDIQHNRLKRYVISERLAQYLQS